MPGILTRQTPRSPNPHRHPIRPAPVRLPMTQWTGVRLREQHVEDLRRVRDALDYARPLAERSHELSLSDALAWLLKQPAAIDLVAGATAGPAEAAPDRVVTAIRRLHRVHRALSRAEASRLLARLGYAESRPDLLLDGDSPSGARATGTESVPRSS